MKKFIIILTVLFFEFLSSNPNFVKKFGCKRGEWLTVVSTGLGGKYMYICGDIFGCSTKNCYKGQPFDLEKYKKSNKANKPDS